MASWSSLPPEIKQHVVKRLDFMSRHSLRHTSRLDRQIVDSTKCQVPRVRFGYKEGRGLIVVYTGIDQFLRLELSEYEGSVLVEKSENSYSASRFEPKLIDTPLNTMEYGISILKSLLAHNSIKICSFEWDFPQKVLDQPDSLLIIATRLLYGTKFHVDEHVSLWKSHMTVEEEKELMNYWSEVKVFRTLGMTPSPDSIKPLLQQDNETRTNSGRRSVSTIINLDTTEFGRLAVDLVFNMMAMLRNTKASLSTGREVEIGVHGKTGKRTVSAAFVTIECTSECGKWKHMMPKEHEKIFKKIIYKKACGIDKICEKCADPFDYWYHQMLPRRIVQEPFWNDVFTSDLNMDRNMIKEMKQTLRADIAKDKKREFQASWGFKESDDPEDSEDVMSSEEEEEEEPVQNDPFALLRSMGARIEPVYVDGNEEEEEAEEEAEVEEIDAPEEEIPTVTPRTKIPYFFMFAFLPILVSIIVYFLYPISF
uniref:F-box domain-containing protein n=1 Tax=Caenorhabditis tropicalis TaxID=1561998 RepID=A0A1I7UE60_9PELO